MSSSFEFDDGAFRRAVGKEVQKGLEELRSSYQRMFDRLIAQYQGRPVEEIKRALRIQWRREGGDITDPELTEYAQSIAEGRRIDVRVR